MGLILDSSILIADERGRFDMPAFLQDHGTAQPATAAITASELRHGVERAVDPARRAARQQHVERVLASVLILPFDLPQARRHAHIWADLASRGLIIGPHDLQIAATALAADWDLATTNILEFQRVPNLPVVDARPFIR